MDFPLILYLLETKWKVKQNTGMSTFGSLLCLLIGFSFICPFLLAAVIIEFSLLWHWRQAEWEKNPELWMVGKLPSESKEILQELTIRSNFWPGPRPLRIYRWTVKWWVIISLYSYALFHLLIVSIRQPQLWPRGYCWIWERCSRVRKIHQT